LLIAEITGCGYHFYRTKKFLPYRENLRAQTENMFRRKRKWRNRGKNIKIEKVFFKKKKKITNRVITYYIFIECACRTTLGMLKQI